MSDVTCGGEMYAFRLHPGRSVHVQTDLYSKAPKIHVYVQKTARPTSLATRPYPLRFGRCDERKDVHKNGDATEEHAIEQWTRGGRRRERSTRLIEVSRHSIQPRCGTGSDEKPVPSRLAQRTDESGRWHTWNLSLVLLALSTLDATKVVTELQVVLHAKEESFKQLASYTLGRRGMPRSTEGGRYMCRGRGGSAVPATFLVTRQLLLHGQKMCRRKQE